MEEGDGQVFTKLLKISVILTTTFFLSNMVTLADENLQQFEGFSLSGYDEDRKKAWDVKGDTADVLGSIIKLTNIVANAYGEEPMNLKAKSGTMDKDTGNMHLETDVVITTDTGGRLETDSLDWNKNEDLVTTQDDVFLSKDGMTATGTGAEAHPGLSKAKINEDVTVNVNAEPETEQGRIITITSDGPLTVEYQLGQAVFQDNVVAVDGDQRLEADQMEIFFDSETNKILKMVCTGNVTIIKGGNTSYSQKAVYLAEEKKMTLSGKPKLMFYAGAEGDSGF